MLKLSRNLLLSIGISLPLVVAMNACDKDSDASDDDDDDNDDDSKMTGGETDGTDDEENEDDANEGQCDIACNPGVAGECGEGQKCAPFACNDAACCTNATRCVAVTGEKEVGQECFRDGKEGRDDCAETYFCMPNMASSADTGTGECIPLCIPGQDQICAEQGLENGHCFNFNDGSLPVCLETCDPLNPKCQKDTQGCYLAIDNFICTDPDLEGTSGQAGEFCNTEQACVAGNACVPKVLFETCENPCSATDPVCGCCAPVCDIKNPDCEDGQECIPILESPAPDLKDVGFCVVPK